MNQQLFLKLEEFYVQLQLGHYDHPVDLAQTLEALADVAWDEVDKLYHFDTLTGVAITDAMAYPPAGGDRIPFLMRSRFL